MYYIYWIKTKDQTNILSEGYVGFSNNPERRLLEHKVSDTVVGNAIRKYENDIDLVVLYEFNNEIEALKKEKELRPRKRMGWNIAVGGQVPPPIKDDVTTKEKISKTIKEMGVVPYCEKTHSKEAIEKSRRAKLEKRYRWFYNPNTLDTKLFSTSKENVPNGWEPGKKPQKLVNKKIRDVDYKCNVKKWKVYKNGNCLLITENLKEWCNDNDIPYIAASRTKSVRKLECFVTYEIGVSVKNTIIENGIDTALTKSDYAKKINRSRSFVSSIVKAGVYQNKIYSIYACKEVKR
jgi:predicted GIY-YIG superfamily endonuclease